MSVRNSRGGCIAQPWRAVSSRASRPASRAVGLEEFRASLPDIAEPIAAIYESAFEEDELRQIVASYRSPLGRKMIEKMPGVIEQSQALGVAWGKKVGERIAAKIKAEAAKRGYAI